VGSVGVQVTQAALAAQQAAFPSAPRGLARTQLVVLTAALHLAQPLARLVGRLGHGLAPWRWCRWAGFASPRPTTTLVWSEQWLAPEARLAAMRAALTGAGAVVGQGGPSDGWDLAVRGGLVGGTRLTLLAEDHHAGRQLVRVRDWPRVRPVAVALFGFFVALTPAALSDGAWTTASVLTVAAALLAARGAYECAKSAAVARRAVGEAAAGWGAQVVPSAARRFVGAWRRRGRAAVPAEQATAGPAAFAGSEVT
jgi:hypothetical protein